MARTLKRIVCGIGALGAALYISNPTAGVLELIPDNLPFWGNLDEAGATALLIYCVRCIRRLHKSVPPLPRS